MKKRLVILTSIGLLVIAATYLLLPTIFELTMMPKPARYYGVELPPKREGLADVQYWGEMPPGEQSYWRAKNAVRLIVIRGEAFSGERRVAREEIRAFLDARVEREKAEYVVLFAAKGSKWGEIFPVIDECRKSRVRIVLLNFREA